jgi:NADH dehydrogenase
VGDVAECFLKASILAEAKGKLYELGGPSIYTFKELMEYLLATIHRKRLLLSLPFPIAKAMASVAQFLPIPPITPDQVELLKSDTVVSPHALTAEDLEVYPKALEAVAPLYLERYRPRGE